MSLPTFRAVVDEAPPLDQELVVCLGPARALPPLPPDRLVAVDRVDAAGLGVIARIDPRRMAGGVVIVSSRAEHERDPKALLRAQKLIAFLFCKFVFLPAHSTRVPDPLGLRSDQTPPEYLHLMHRDRNMGQLLRRPLFDKLRDERVGLPCLILMPGPSVRAIAEALPELARRHLVITIARLLPLLRQCGVAPDVVVQLDTVPMQEQFHHPDERFPESVLLALSCAPVWTYAPRFRHTFFIDSFDLNVLQNSARLRESWLSSFIPCLGAAEALGAPKILIAGSDLCHRGTETYYNDSAEAQAPPPHEGPLVCAADGNVRCADAQGRQITSTLQMLATAAEAEFIAHELRANRRTSFFDLTPGGMLDQDVYRPLKPEQALGTRALDKSALLEKADRAAAGRENIDLPLHFERCEVNMEQARRGRDLMACLGLDPGPDLDQTPYARYVAAFFPWFRPADAPGQRATAARLAEEVHAAARRARNIAALHLQASLSLALPVLCTGEEEPEAAAALGRLHPGWKWRFIGLRGLPAERPEPSGGVVELTALYEWLRRQRVTVIAPGCGREFGYALDLVKGDNVIGLDDLLADAPLV